MAQFAVVALALIFTVGVLQGAAACSFDSSKNCAQPVNIDCDQCKLYQVATDPKGPCKKPGTVDLCKVVGTNTIQIASGDVTSKTPHWKVVPTTAIKGLEEITSSGTAGKYDQLWREGRDAFNSKSLPSSKTVSTGFNPGFFVNSPTTRTQHQLHVHIAPIKSTVYTDLGIKQPTKFGPQWTQSKTASGAKTAFMQCPKSGAPLEPFTQFVKGIGTFKPAIANPNQDASLLVFKPSWCKGSGTCDFCQFVLYHVGDKEVLNY